MCIIFPNRSYGQLNYEYENFFKVLSPTPVSLFSYPLKKTHERLWVLIRYENATLVKLWTPSQQIMIGTPLQS